MLTKRYNSVDKPPYKVWYKCANCKKKVEVGIVYGRLAPALMRECPNCGIGVLHKEENQENKNV